MSKIVLQRIMLLFTAFWLFTVLSIKAQSIAVKVSDVDGIMINDSKPILVLLSADWCTYCNLQKRQIVQNKNFNVQKSTFYFVELDIAMTDLVVFNAQTFRYKPSGLNVGVHELAEYLNGRADIALPAWVLLDKNYQVLYRYNGVMSKRQLNELIDIINRMDAAS